MTTLVGNAAGSLEYTDVVGQSGNITDTDAGLSVFDGWLAVDIPDDGTFSDNLPIAAQSSTLDGYRGFAGSGNDHWYHRFHIISTPIDVGNVVSDSVATFYIWNAYLTNKSMTAYSVSTIEGITVDAPVTPVYNFKSLTILDYAVNVDKRGPFTIDLTITWVIGGETLTVDVSGKRIVSFPFKPNWSSPVNETLEWLTDITRSYSGMEQRRSLRSKPRRSFEYQATLYGRDTAELESKLWGWQNRSFAVPVWTDNVGVTAAVDIGDTLISVESTDNLSFFAGGMAVLFDDVFNHEVVEVLSIGSTTIGLAYPTTGAWPAGTQLMPVNVGRLPVQFPMQRITNGLVYASVRVACDPVLTDPYIPVEAAATTYEGYEVMTTKPNWVSPLDNVSEYQYQLLDFNTGAVEQGESEAFPRTIRKYSWLLKNRQQISDFRAFLGRRKGSTVPVLIPTWHMDMQLAVDLAGSESYIVIEGTTFVDMVGYTTYRDKLCIRTRTGETVYCTITNVEETFGGNTQITLADAVGIPVTVDNVLSISILALSRLATDSVSLQWQSNGVVIVETNFITVAA